MRGPQHTYGERVRSNWGSGDTLAQYAIGDVVYVPEDCFAVTERRCKAGLHRVESCFSIGEDASFYYRLSPCEIVGAKGSLRVRTNWDEVSDRLHVFPGPEGIDYIDGFVLLFTQTTATQSAPKSSDRLPVVGSDDG